MVLTGGLNLRGASRLWVLVGPGDRTGFDRLPWCGASRDRPCGGECPVRAGWVQESAEVSATYETAAEYCGRCDSFRLPSRQV